MNIREQYAQALEQKVIQLAREDINVFCRYVMRDEKGNPFSQAPMHKAWHGFIDFCELHERRPIILAPWGSGKSGQVSIARCLWELGRDPSLRIKIVSNADEIAKLRVASIGRYITESREYSLVFPDVKPDRKGSWSAHSLFVERKGRSVDPSIEAKGIMATGIGGRADIIIFDDVVDQRNAIEQPALRAKVKDNFANVWMSRLDQGGRTWYIATAWHHDDLTSYLRFNAAMRDSYWVMTQAITDDLEWLRVTLEVSDGYEKLVREAIESVVGEDEIGDITFNSSVG